VKAVRALYKIAKGYVTLDAGDAARTHVEALKQTLPQSTVFRITGWSFRPQPSDLPTQTRAKGAPRGDDAVLRRFEQVERPPLRRDAN